MFPSDDFISLIVSEQERPAMKGVILKKRKEKRRKERKRKEKKGKEKKRKKRKQCTKLANRFKYKVNAQAPTPFIGYKVSWIAC